jgi:hypothetical protein
MDDSDYDNIGYSVSGRSGLLFGVAACNDVHVALTETPGVQTRRAYELVIGASGNSQTLLKDASSGSSLAQVSSANILSCNAVKSFWLSWTNASVSFGTGTVLEVGRVLYHRDPNLYAISAISVKTPYGVVGNFSFERFTGITIFSTVFLFENIYNTVRSISFRSIL